MIDAALYVTSHLARDQGKCLDRCWPIGRCELTCSDILPFKSRKQGVCT